MPDELHLHAAARKRAYQLCVIFFPPHEFRDACGLDEIQGDGRPEFYRGILCLSLGSSVSQEFRFMRDLRESVRYNLRDPRQLPPDLIPALKYFRWI